MDIHILMKTQPLSYTTSKVRHSPCSPGGCRQIGAVKSKQMTTEPSGSTSNKLQGEVVESTQKRSIKTLTKELQLEIGLKAWLKEKKERASISGTGIYLRE